MTYTAFYDNGMAEELFNKQELINDMQEALDNEQFVVYFQPKVKKHFAEQRHLSDGIIRERALYLRENLSRHLNKTDLLHSLIIMFGNIHVFC